MLRVRVVPFRSVSYRIVPISSGSLSMKSSRPPPLSHTRPWRRSAVPWASLRQTRGLPVGPTPERDAWQQGMTWNDYVLNP